MKQELLNAVLQEHEVIEYLLNDFESFYDNDLVKAEEILEVFVWNLEKHMFLEEKILYNVYSVWDGNIDGMFEILSDHGDIMIFIKKIKSSTFNKSDIYSLRELLENHFAVEETILYPNLEKALSSEQKKILIERTLEVIRG
jgi:iron-sulfur cluster repair protein YtfE (RIC family)